MLRNPGPALGELGARSEVFALAEPIPSETPEAAWFGMDPSTVALRPGPLAVAAFGVDPPERSVQFQVDVMALKDGVLAVPDAGPGSAALDRIHQLAARLETSKLRWVQGDGLRHGLVWENGSIEMETRSPESCAGKEWHDSLPVGDGEPLLRRFVDDSVNLLAEEEFNLRRVDEGLLPLNVLWPWGQGFREPVPNLWLERGERLHLESRSLRLEGLARLARCTHGDRTISGKGIAIPMLLLAESALERSPIVIVIDAFEALRREERWEEAEWLLARLDAELLEPILAKLRAGDTRVAVFAPGLAGRGVGMVAESGPPVEGPWPFDERLLEEAKAPERTTWQAVRQAVAP
ncbi:MAG: hypothetical protein H6534_05285 [Chthonomonadaceae bacterium]|nr:hypothetical protein [Chthonomonadaceae bacterium]